MAWLTGVSSPCLTISRIISSSSQPTYRSYFLARATTRPLMKSTSDCLFLSTSTHMEVLFSCREAITWPQWRSVWSIWRLSRSRWSIWRLSRWGWSVGKVMRSPSGGCGPPPRWGCWPPQQRLQPDPPSPAGWPRGGTLASQTPPWQCVSVANTKHFPTLLSTWARGRWGWTWGWRRGCRAACTRSASGSPRSPRTADRGSWTGRTAAAPVSGETFYVRSW